MSILSDKYPRNNFSNTNSCTIYAVLWKCTKLLSPVLKCICTLNPNHYKPWHIHVDQNTYSSHTTPTIGNRALFIFWLGSLPLSAAKQFIFWCVATLLPDRHRFSLYFYWFYRTYEMEEISLYTFIFYVLATFVPHADHKRIFLWSPCWITQT